MKILLLTTHLNIGGIGTYTVSLAKALKAKGMEVFVGSSGGVLISELTQGAISHININMRTKSELSPKVFRAVFEITDIVRRLNIDIIHCQTRITQVIGFIVSRLCKVHFISTCHGFFRRNIGRFLFPCWGEMVIAISNAVRENLISYFKVDENRIKLIYNAIDIKKFLKDFSEDEKVKLKDKFGLRRDYNIIGTVARFTPDKGHDALIYGLFEMLKKKPNIQMVFIGDGKEKKRIVDIVQRLNLSEHVIFIKPQINTANVLSVMDVFMFTPARKEGMGLVLLEAFASGKPVVATNVGGIPDVVENGVNGFLIEPSRPELLVEPTLKLLKDKELYKKMSQLAIETAVRKFSINGMADKVETLYKEVMTRGIEGQGG